MTLFHGDSGWDSASTGVGMDEGHRLWLRRAIDLSQRGSAAGVGGPFGCVVVRAGGVVGEGYNEVLAGNDPTAHAEIVAIRRACAHLGDHQLTGCVVYASCEPCPMCLGAIYWARPAAVYYANTQQEAAAIGFDDAFIYREIERSPMNRSIPFLRIDLPEARKAFDEWTARVDVPRY